MTGSPRYAIHLASSARRDLERLPAKVATAIIEFMTRALAENPARLSKPLTGELAMYRSARRGDYRVLIRVDEDTRAVVVVRIDHRADVYRPR